MKIDEIKSFAIKCIEENTIEKDYLVLFTKLNAPIKIKLNKSNLSL